MFYLLQLYFSEKLQKHQHDPDFNKAAFLDRCKEQWRSMSDKKKLAWINYAVEDEARYQV